MFAMENLPFFLACVFFSIGIILSVSGLKDEKITLMNSDSSNGNKPENKIHKPTEKGGFGFGPQSDPKRETPKPPLDTPRPRAPQPPPTPLSLVNRGVSFTSDQKKEINSIVREAMAREERADSTGD